MSLLLVISGPTPQSNDALAIEGIDSGNILASMNPQDNREIRQHRAQPSAHPIETQLASIDLR
jgi:hypothetical protein